MIYTPMTHKAMMIAYDAHHGQADKTGIPYIFHPIHMAEQMHDENAVCVALLHDVVEDSDVSIEQLREAGFNDDIVTAVELLTRDPSVSYMNYIEKLSHNPLAREVKIADLKHNADTTRFKTDMPIHDDESIQSHRRRYIKALKLLTKDNNNAE